MLATSPVRGAEEFAIHDHEGFLGIPIGEYKGLNKVADIAAFLAEHGALGAELFQYLGGSSDEARQALAERYLGSYASAVD